MVLFLFRNHFTDSSWFVFRSGRINKQNKTKKKDNAFFIDENLNKSKKGEKENQDAKKTIYIQESTIWMNEYPGYK